MAEEETLEGPGAPRHMEMCALLLGRMLRPQKTLRKRHQRDPEPCEMSEGPGALKILSTSLMGALGVQDMLPHLTEPILELERRDTGDVEGTGLL